MNTYKRFFNLVMLLLLSVGLLGFNVAPAMAGGDTCTQYYTVQRGDYLTKIGRMFNVSWRYLADINNLENPSRIYSGQRLCVSTDGSVSNPTLPNTGSKAQVWIDRVVEDDYAVIEARNLPANTRVDVLFARPKATVSGSTRVGRVTTNRNGVLSEAFEIPERLVDIQKIFVYLRIDNKVVAENWFYNATASGNTGNNDDQRDNDDLILRVIAVDANDDVTLSGRNFPATTWFDVFMAERRSGAQDWIEVDSVRTNRQGRFEETFDIPRQLRNVDEIQVLIQTDDEEYEAYARFTNRNQDIDDRVDDDDDDADVPNFPFLTPTAVVRDRQVTLRFTNMPAGVEYDVLMGKIGTKGESGTFVGTIYTARGGTIEKTFDIPASLRGASRIAIRMEALHRSPNSYAYNWFTNQSR